MKASSSICQINHCNLYIPRSEMYDMGGRVISLPSLDIHEYLQQGIRESDIIKKHHTSVDDISTESVEQHPISCMIDDNVILGANANCGYINSSHSSSCSSISDTTHLVQRLTSVYDNQDSQSLLDSDLLNAEFISNDMSSLNDLQPVGEISLSVPSFPNKSLEDITMRSTPVDKTDDDNSFSTSSSLSPTHKHGVPSKAAAILGAREVFISPSHAAYRRLVDYTHRPPNDGKSLLNTEAAPYPPTMAHPSLTARPHRQSKPDMKPYETSPEKKLASKYKIINIGMDDVREKLNFLKRPGELLAQSGNTETNSTKVTKSKDADKLLKAGGASLKQIRRWSNSFEELLHDRYGLALFHEYLKSEYSEENIEFWIACEEYRAISNPKKMAIRAHKIIKDFVATQASKEINLDSKTRQLTLENIHHPNTKMFEMAQKRIQTLMEIDSYQRFLRSTMYQSLLQEVTSGRASGENTKRASGENPNSPPASILADIGGKVTSSGNCVTTGSIDIPGDSDGLMSLHNFRSNNVTCKQSPSVSGTVASSSSSTIVRISSVKTTRSDSSAQSVIPPSNSDHCLNNASR